jgi:hypothetical protein
VPENNAGAKEEGRGRWNSQQHTPFTVDGGARGEATCDSGERQQDHGTTRAEGGRSLQDEPAEAHPAQRRPPANVYNLARLLYSRPVNEWNIEDITTPNSSDGMSILLLVFVDYAATKVRPEMTLVQRLSVANMARATAPRTLLEILQARAKAEDYIRWATDTKTKPPPVLERMLHPSITPELITNEEVRRRVRNEDSLLRSEQLDVIKLFVDCYYPRAWAGIKEFLLASDAASLHRYITWPGEMVRDMRRKYFTMTFAPPSWYRLSIHPEEKMSGTPLAAVTPKMTWASVPVSRADLQSKLNLSSNELKQLNILTLRTTTLSLIPRIFEERLTADGLMDTLQLFQTAEREEILSFLNITTDETDNRMLAKKALSFIYYIRLDHITRRNKGEWLTSGAEVLLRWVNAILPVLLANRFDLTLIWAPFERDQAELHILNNVHDTQELGKFAQAKEGEKRFSRLGVWIK